MATVLECVVGDLDITECRTTSAGRRILAAEITLVTNRPGQEWSDANPPLIGYRPEVELMVHDKVVGRVFTWSMTILSDDLRIPGRWHSDDPDLEDWIVGNQEISDRLHQCSEATMAAVDAGRVAVVPYDQIYDIAGRTMVIAGDDNDGR